MGTYDEEEGAAEVATPIDFFDFFSVVLFISTLSSSLASR
jgi:hypothetical protein